LTSTSCKDIARRTLEECLAGRVPEFPEALAADECGEALFGILVEGLADRFEPALCDAYVKLFSQAVACVAGLDAAELEARYNRVRQVRPWTSAHGGESPGHRHRAATESGHRSPETLMTAPFGRGSVGFGW